MTTSDFYEKLTGTRFSVMVSVIFDTRNPVLEAVIDFYQIVCFPGVWYIAIRF